VTEQELEDWMRYVQTRYVRMDTDRQWSEHNPDNTATLSWASYKHKVYAFTEGLPMKLFIYHSDCNCVTDPHPTPVKQPRSANCTFNFLFQLFEAVPPLGVDQNVLCIFNIV